MPTEDQPDSTPEPLWREVVGRVLRGRRAERGETLIETSRRAGVSPQYLSEMERGLKEPSSEMLAAVSGALELTLLDLATEVADRITPVEQIPARTPVRAQGVAYALAA